jgi:hypothetical protein
MPRVCSIVTILSCRHTGPACYQMPLHSISPSMTTQLPYPSLSRSAVILINSRIMRVDSRDELIFISFRSSNMETSLMNEVFRYLFELGRRLLVCRCRIVFSFRYTSTGKQQTLPPSPRPTGIRNTTRAHTMREDYVTAGINKGTDLLRGQKLYNLALYHDLMRQ